MAELGLEFLSEAPLFASLCIYDSRSVGGGRWQRGEVLFSGIFPFQAIPAFQGKWLDLKHFALKWGERAKKFRCEFCPGRPSCV